MNRHLTAIGAPLALGTFLLTGATAEAAGTLVQGDGSFVGGVTSWLL